MTPPYNKNPTGLRPVGFWRAIGSLGDHVVVLGVPGLCHGGGVVQEDDISDIHAAKCLQGLQFNVAGIHNDNVAVMLGQEGNKGVAVGVLKDQSGLVLGILRHIDDGITIVATDECSVTTVGGVDAGIISGGLAV